MRSASLLVPIGAAWLGVGPFLAHFMSRRGYDAVSWLAVGSILGPAALALAAMERLPGTVHHPEVVVRGSAGIGHMRLLLSVDYGEGVLATANPVIEKFEGHLERVTLVGVLPKGGPLERLARTRESLKRVTTGVPDEAEAMILFGSTNDALVAKAADEGYQIVMTASRDEDLATRLRSSGIRYLASAADAERMLTRECLAFPSTRAPSA